MIFEFLSPGAVAPGLIGAISLLVALYALNLLPINYAGAGLVLLGIGLVIAEVHIGAFGAIGVGGIVAFAIGAVMMFPSGVPGSAHQALSFKMPAKGHIGHFDYPWECRLTPKAVVVSAAASLAAVSMASTMPPKQFDPLSAITRVGEHHVRQI
jgi:hypothetical protein